MGPEGEIKLSPGQKKGWVGHVPVVGWLLLVHSILALAFAVGLIALGIMLPGTIAAEAENNPTIQDQGMSPEQLELLIQVVYGGMGVGLLVISLMGIVAAIQILRFRSYLFDICALSAGFFTVMAGCYCFPTALALGIYGLVVMLNPAVKTAFELGKAGKSAKEIKAAFKDLPV